MRMATMVKYFQFQDAQNNAIDVNSDHIEMVKPSSDADTPTIIHLTSSKEIKVKQTVEEIRGLIRLHKPR
jgi:hypothetical protein